MPAWIRQIETMTPAFAFAQEDASRKMQEWARTDRERRIIRALYRQSGIEKRHSVITDFDGEPGNAFFSKGPDGGWTGPGTRARNDIFARETRRMSVDLSRRVLEECPGIAAADVTHVVTVSCTGFYNPGPDYFIVRELGLSHATQRYHLGFMGCYAALPALRMAAQFCEADPDAVVLVLSIELCSLHMQLGAAEDFLLANSLFSDGAGAAIVTARPPGPDRSAYRIGKFRSTLVPNGEGDMAWRIGDQGFDIALSAYVPKLIGANIREFIEPSLAGIGLSLDDVGTWAVHPGGKAIVDQVQSSLGLRPEQVAAARNVLRSFGNMSSATILFVLRDILYAEETGAGQRVCAMAFGPGLAVEMAMLETRPAIAQASEPSA
jgi:predicted naringenin-chalcone synthase